MHELSLVDELISECCRLAEGRPVLEVFVSCAEGTDTDEVAESFGFLTSHSGAGGGRAVMSGARLQMSSVPAQGRCRCGFAGELKPEAVAGHMFICPGCGAVADQEPVLRLKAMTFAGAPS